MVSPPRDSQPARDRSHTEDSQARPLARASSGDVPPVPSGNENAGSSGGLGLGLLASNTAAALRMAMTLVRADSSTSKDTAPTTNSSSVGSRVMRTLSTVSSGVRSNAEMNSAVQQAAVVAAAAADAQAERSSSAEDMLYAQGSRWMGKSPNTQLTQQAGVGAGVVSAQPSTRPPSQSFSSHQGYSYPSRAAHDAVVATEGLKKFEEEQRQQRGGRGGEGTRARPPQSMSMAGEGSRRASGEAELARAAVAAVEEEEAGAALAEVTMTSRVAAKKAALSKQQHPARAEVDIKKGRTELEAGKVRERRDVAEKSREHFERERVERERIERERVERERVERERIEGERIERERVERERVERERVERERIEWDRFEQERLERERLEQERLERERLEQERLERERLEQKRLEQERLERERLERERFDRERYELERLGREQLDRERLERHRFEREKRVNREMPKEKTSEQRSKVPVTSSPTYDLLDPALAHLKATEARRGTGRSSFLVHTPGRNAFLSPTDPSAEGLSASEASNAHGNPSKTKAFLGNGVASSVTGNGNCNPLGRLLEEEEGVDAGADCPAVPLSQRERDENILRAHLASWRFCFHEAAALLTPVLGASYVEAPDDASGGGGGGGRDVADGGVGMGGFFAAAPAEDSDLHSEVSRACV